MSIIVPVYNVEKYLATCLDSILTQNFNDFEVICIDDFSKDASRLILEQYEEKDERIKVYYNNINKGLSATRNMGIYYAIGEYILFVDSDDYLIEDTLELLIAEADKLRVEVLSFDAETVYELKGGQRYNGIRENTYIGCISGVESFIEQYDKADYKCAVWHYLYKREFLLKKNLFFVENIYHEDNVFTFFMYMYTQKIAYMNKTIYVYRIRENSITTDESILVKRVKDLIYIYQYSYNCMMGLGIMENKALSIQLEYLRRNIVNSFHRCNMSQKLACREIENPIQKHIFDVLTSSYAEMDLSQNEVEELKRAKELYLYGAGEYARRWIHILDEYNIELKGILVTHPSSTNTNLYGYKIYGVKEICEGLDKKILVILAVSEQYVSEIRRELNRFPYVEVWEKGMNK
ncbi:MAG: glycosyltransferase [Lachnospiraceae bacterium]|nr:glycosyltransferase [Lachnospiraceae bacterium]